MAYQQYGQAPYYYQPYGYSQALQQPFQQIIQQAQPTATARLVTSREEAVAAQIAFDNTVNVFLNLNAGEVYVKRFNMQTGGADFEAFGRIQPAPEKPEISYATMETVEQLRAQLDAVYAELQTLKTTTIG